MIQSEPVRPLSRSLVNSIVRDALQTFESRNFHLPKFASWTPADWQRAGPEWNTARQSKLGWDVTDFGLGDFLRVGRTLFTLRNGTSRETHKPYAEKIILGRHGQRAPAHFHKTKIEDIINRGGGVVVLALKSPSPVDIPAVVFQDGREISVGFGLTIRLLPGESLCIPPGIIHQFWGEETETGTIPFIGEVSSFCDDVNDNVFSDPVCRFPEIKEDEPAEFCLCNEIPEALTVA